MTPRELKAARHALGLSVGGLAALLTDPAHDKPPIDPRTIRRWESGQRDIPHPAVVLVKLMVEKKRES